MYHTFDVYNIYIITNNEEKSRENGLSRDRKIKNLFQDDVFRFVFGDLVWRAGNNIFTLPTRVLLRNFGDRGSFFFHNMNYKFSFFVKSHTTHIY